MRPSDEYMTILCIATYFKGGAFLRECRRQGCTVLLLTSDTLVAEVPKEKKKRGGGAEDMD